jgi:hypothetical protein
MHPCYWKVGLRWALPSHAQCSDGSLATCHPRCGMTQKGHVVSSLEVLHPRSPSQQCSTSPHHDTEGAVRRFISTVSKAIPAVVSMASATHRRAKLKLPYIVDGPPHRSARVATQGRRRVNKSEVQAQNVLMWKWHITSLGSSLDADAIAAYNKVFQMPLHSSQRRAIYALFSTCLSPRGVDGDLLAWSTWLSGCLSLV